MRFLTIQVFLYALLSNVCLNLQSAEPTKKEVQAALHKAVTFFNEEISVQGGYLWRYSADLSKKEGEGKVDDTTAWLQPPGTPFVGDALLELYELTGDPYCLEAARNTAMALVKGQLCSGGWDHKIEFDPKDRRRSAYRVDDPKPGDRRNISTLDDDKTQSALRFLIHFDQVTNFENETVHEAVLYGLDGLIDAQYPNGGWPHGFIKSPDPDKYPVLQASYSEDDEYTHVKEYWWFYTLNDNLMSDVINTLMLAVQVYDNPRYSKALKQAGNFLILAQMPDPQPGWAQQYDFDMHPAWARKFEPPAITGSESQQVMMSLMDLYEFTGDEKFLEPIPNALQYYKSSLLPNGRLARFYELKTNKPLYFTRDYKLTYNDDDMPTHYGFKVGSRLDRIERRYDKVSKEPWIPQKQTKKNISNPSSERVHEIIQSMDDRGAWVEEGRLRYWEEDNNTKKIIDPRTFAENAKTLAHYLHHQN